jgi:hypothetical protein
MEEDHLIQGAIAAHYRRCKRCGAIHQQPSPTCSEVEEDVVILRNGYRELGRYRFVEGRKRFECIEEAP